MRDTEHHRANPSDVHVRLPDGRRLSFSDPFTIGRDADCEIQVDDPRVSRRHATVSRAQGRWIIRDLQSGNGLFVNGRRVDAAPVDGAARVTLGTGGPQLVISTGAETGAGSIHRRPAAAEKEVSEYEKRYFGTEDDPSAGDHTMMIRKAFQRVQLSQRRRNRLIVGALSVAFASALGYAAYAHYWMLQYRKEAESSFYNMKAAEVGSLQGSNQDVVQQYRAQREAYEKDYEKHFQRLYDRGLSDEDKLILSITRLFGECEVSAPAEYIREVKREIRNWQGPREKSGWVIAVNRANRLGYTERIARAFDAQGLPPQYFYLAMQESKFNEQAVGTETNWGYAKGMWQFIEDTGTRYGLQPGPLTKMRVYDPADERFHWNKATIAASRYIKDIYSTDAQASGLLVMASYNWGERRVVQRLKKMPADPRQRNFWNLLRNYSADVPDETRNYVFRIVAAAVIGENPRLFGFNMDNPLKPFVSSSTHERSTSAPQ